MPLTPHNIESAFVNLKSGMRRLQECLSRLKSYLDEYTWRHNANRGGHALFAQLLERLAA
jgi:hypothetical protein